MAAASRQSRLFTLRMWQDETGDGQLEWRGKVQALPEGEVYYFRSWAGLIEHLEVMLEAGHTQVRNSESSTGGEA
jgi:hypothetical protein